MIQEVRFEEFRALRSLRVSFERLTVLVGPNGSGKSIILEEIHALLQIAHRPLQQVLAGPWRPDRLRNTRASGPLQGPDAGPCSGRGLATGQCSQVEKGVASVVKGTQPSGRGSGNGRGDSFPRYCLCGRCLEARGGLSRRVTRGTSRCDGCAR